MAGDTSSVILEKHYVIIQAHCVGNTVWIKTKVRFQQIIRYFQLSVLRLMGLNAGTVKI